jgi:multidrug efflux pump subunit AcrA (membrane-fusion protein)
MSNFRAFGLNKLVLVTTVLTVAGISGMGIRWLNRPAVAVTRVVEGPVVQAFYATGTVRPRIEYPIGSNVAGIVEQVLVSQGQSVKKEQELAIVVDPGLQYQADKTRADLRTRRDFADEATSPVLREFDQRLVATREMLRVVQQQEQRFAALAEKNAASANDRDQAIEHTQKLWADVEALKAQRAVKLRELQQDVEVAEAADRAARENLRRQTLRSPVDGVILDQPIAQGTRVEINGHVMQIADVGLNNLIMRAAVDEENVARAETGQRVKMTLYSFPAQTFDGVVEQKYPKADATRRTFDVDIKFLIPEPRLQAGMTGELAFIDQTRDRALVVPTQAVQNNAVWAVRDGRLADTKAVLGIKSIERIEIKGGVRLGDTIVISPLVDPQDGQAVRVGSVMDPTVAANLNKPKDTQLFNAFH